MAYAHQGAGALDYFPCRYGTSRLRFRGPCRDLTGPYVAVLGGTETYGKFVPRPYPALVEEATGLRMVNLGCTNAGPDVFLNDPTVLEIAARARLAVVQILGAQNLTNRFYTVHPRRNDRFLAAALLLRQMFPEVDFTEFHFTRHMLRALRAASPDRFEVVAEELRAAWVARMGDLLGRLRGRAVLLWMGAEAAPPAGQGGLEHDPILVDADMIAAVRGRAIACVEVVASPQARARGVEGLAFAPLERPAAMVVPGPAVHAEVAAALAPRLIGLI
jgi:hypothetical protein